MVEDNVNKVKSQSERIMAIPVMERWLISRVLKKWKLEGLKKKKG